MDVLSLRRIRHGVRATLTLGVAASVTANVLHAQPTLVGRAIAAWPPLALLLTIELISRVSVAGRALTWVRMAATAAIAAIAAWVSYWHMVEVAARHGETPVSARLVPLSVDGLVVVASVCLVEMASRLRTVEATQHAGAVAAPATGLVVPSPASAPQTGVSGAASEGTTGLNARTTRNVASPGATGATDHTETARAGGVPRRRPGSGSVAGPRRGQGERSRVARAGEDTAAAVARLRAEDADVSAVEIARRLGVTDRTVRRHLAAPAAIAEQPRTETQSVEPLRGRVAVPGDEGPPDDDRADSAAMDENESAA